MFNTEEAREVMTNSIEDKVNEILLHTKEILSSPMYEEVVKKFDIKIEDGKLKTYLEVPDEFSIGNQDVFRLLIYGGVIEKKKGGFVRFPPNSILMRYFS